MTGTTAAATTPPEDTARAAQVVRDTIRALVLELHPGHVPDIRDQASLDADLGLDSLAIVELRARIEAECGVALPDTVFDAATVSAWTDAVTAAARQRTRAFTPAPSREAHGEPQPGDGVRPDRLVGDAHTLTDVMLRHAQAHPDRVHARVRTYHGADPTEVELRYAQIAAAAHDVARALVQREVAVGDPVAIMLPTSSDYFATFLGVLLARAVPVPLYPPFRRRGLEEHLRRQARILTDAGAVGLVTVPEVHGLARLLRAQTPSLRFVTTARQLAGAPATTPLPRSHPDDVALLQYTSGSTGDPKGVVLTHAHLLANIRALGDAAHAGPDDTFVSWLPLYHDMGLIGAWLGSLYHAMPLVVMPTTDFLARPVRWLQAIHDHRATLSAAPNFGYELCLRRISNDDLTGVDLSTWRTAFNGAEPVSAETIRRFTERFAPYGFRPGTMAPVYGLAEAAVGLTLPPPGRTPVVDTVRRDTLSRTGRAVTASAGEAAIVDVVGCGFPLVGYRVRTVDPAGHELGEREEGRIEFTGPSATPGYLNAPEANARLRPHDDWIDTGDLGYLANGELFVTGRAKDIIIRAGRNLHPRELEDAIGGIDGVRTGCVAVFAATDPVYGTERLVVLAESRVQEPAALADLRRSIATVTIDLLGTPPDDVVLAPPGAVLKTTSGKIRRAACRARYESGAALTVGAGAAWWQVVRFACSGAVPQLRRWRRAVAATAYAAWAWTVLLLVGPIVWGAVQLVPSARWRWWVTRSGGRVLRLATATRLRVVDSAGVPGDGPCVIVANHASYLDGLALMLALPRPAFFVAAAGFRTQRLVGRFLTRLGTEFIEHRPDTGAAALRRIGERLRHGEPVVFFPEGGRSLSPGLCPFHLGAFQAAVAADAPVVPAGIRGTRSVLSTGHLLPHHAPVTVAFGPALTSVGTGWHNAVALRDAARRAVLALSGERDAG